VEGWKSLNTDPTNFSAHRFLSDSYSALPRHEIARVSELLQSQLLQPINVTPLQPHLAQANLFLLAGSGPSGPSFNEFNPLFNRDRVTLQLNGVGGTNSTVGDEAILAGVWGPVSYSVGQFHYQTDGFRKNNDLKDNVYNAFLQFSLTPQTSLQGEVWAKNTQFGDLALRFYPNDILWNRQKEETWAVRLGFRHGFSPGSDLIGSFIFQDVDYDNQTVNFGVLDIDGKETSYSGELQYLFRSRMLNLVAGAGYFDVNRIEDWTFISPAPSPAPFPFPRVSARIHHANIYLYSYINYLKNVTLTLGASADFFSGGVVDQNQFNPKLGLTWNPFASTTLRAAFFRTFRRTLINNQTIEPTQVAGFNQFFDDDNSEGADAWCYGIALDQKFSRDLFAGAGYSGRKLQVPWREVQGTTTLVHRADWEERLARVYLFWTPHPWFALSAEYQYEWIDRDRNQVGSGIANARTQRIPLGVSFYHPSGLSALFKATFFDQSGRFQHAYPDPDRPFFTGEDSFWILDAAISYRLPKRYGFLTFGIKNLLDNTFRYFDTDIKNPQIQPGRFIYGKVTLGF
jgi:outer membrane receptor protein involved in Fe transport